MVQNQFTFGNTSFALPVECPIARRSDPPTSHLASSAVNLGAAQAIALNAARACCSAQPDATANEIAATGASLHIGIMAETIRKRVRELADAGLLLEVQARRCTISGKKCAAFVPS